MRVETALLFVTGVYSSELTLDCIVISAVFFFFKQKTAYEI